MSILDLIGTARDVMDIRSNIRSKIFKVDYIDENNVNRSRNIHANTPLEAVSKLKRSVKGSNFRATRLTNL